MLINISVKKFETLVQLCDVWSFIQFSIFLFDQFVNWFWFTHFRQEIDDQNYRQNGGDDHNYEDHNASDVVQEKIEGAQTHLIARDWSNTIETNVGARSVTPANLVVESKSIIRHVCTLWALAVENVVWICSIWTSGARRSCITRGTRSSPNGCISAIIDKTWASVG